jgi:hypothetical protein
MKVIQVKCPSCNSPLYMKQKDSVFYCDKCNVMHVRDKGVEKIDFEIGEFNQTAQGERVFMPFWRVYANLVVRNKSVEGGTLFKIASFLKGDTNTGNIFIYIPATDVDANTFKMLATSLTTSAPRYRTRLNFGGIARLPAAITKEAAAELADFVVVTIEAEQPGTLQRLDYQLTINDTKLVYLPFVRSGAGLAPALG